MNAPGFTRNNSINWDLFGPWYDANKKSLGKDADESLEFYKKEIAKRDIQIQDLKIQKLKKEALDPAEVKALLTKIGLAQSALLKSKLTSDLPPRLVGLSLLEIFSLMDSTVQDICGTFKKEFDKWMKQ